MSASLPDAGSPDTIAMDASASGARPRSQLLSRRALALVAIAALALAWASIVQESGWTQNAHYALVRAFDHGTPQIDAYQETTGDKAYTDGHFYSVKAPGLAYVSLPPYLVLRAVAGERLSDRTTIWLLNLLTTIPLAIGLLVLVRRIADVFAPGTGTLVAFTLGAATLVLPFATLYFSHVAAAALGFAAFFVLFRARTRAVSLELYALAGVLAGLACVFEYPSAIVALALGAYALGRDRLGVRMVAYAAGGIVGLAPLLVYNTWAYGSPTHLSYTNAVVQGGDSGHDVIGEHDHGVFGITAPSLRAISELLLENRGLLVLTPVVAAGVAGAVLLYRQGWRAESILTICLCAAFLLYNSGLTTTFGGPFGGDSPGPRYLVAVLPFALMPLGLTYRRAPGTTIALGLVSLTTMVVATVTDPLVDNSDTELWFKDAIAGAFRTTVASLGDDSAGSIRILPTFLLILASLAAVAISLAGSGLRRADLVEGAAAVLIWLGLVALVRAALMPETTLKPVPSIGQAALALLLAAVAVALQVLVVRLTHPRPVAESSTGVGQ